MELILVGENGIQLSGGQRRISIARALVTNPKILILDEATSNLDLGSEKHIINTLQNLHNKLTIIIVTHRINSIVLQIVYYLEDGKIVDQGNLIIFSKIIKILNYLQPQNKII